MERMIKEEKSVKLRESIKDLIIEEEKAALKENRKSIIRKDEEKPEKGLNKSKNLDLGQKLTVLDKFSQKLGKKAVTEMKIKFDESETARNLPVRSSDSLPRKEHTTDISTNFKVRLDLVSSDYDKKFARLVSTMIKMLKCIKATNDVCP